jgi:hypothetical protein
MNSDCSEDPVQQAKPDGADRALTSWMTPSSAGGLSAATFPKRLSIFTAGREQYSSF